MAVVMVMHWPQATREHYEQARRRVRSGDDEPDGCIDHIAWFEDDGLHVVEIWESANEFERVADERLLPAVQRELDGLGAPIVRYADLHAHFVPETARV